MGLNSSIGTTEKSCVVDVIILMAGVGNRLWPLTKDRPKALLCCNDGVSILEHILRALRSGVKRRLRFIPVIGHGREEVERLFASIESRELAKLWPVCNPYYASAGPLFSLWLGLLRADAYSDVIVVNGDTLLKERLASAVEDWFEDLRGSERRDLGLCASFAQEFEADDMKVEIGVSRDVRRVGKDMTNGRPSAKSAGVLCIRNNARREVERSIVDVIMNGRGLESGYSWHTLVNEVQSVVPVDFIEVPHDSWREVDIHLDLQTMRRLLEIA